MNFRWPVTLLAGVLYASPAVSQSLPEADPEKARPIAAELCAACHGPDGNSALPENPIIAGQHAAYTLKQLRDFKPQDGKRVMRPNDVMAGMVAGLSDEDMRNLAAYYEAQRPKPRAAQDAELARLGQAIYRGGVMEKGVAACAACHGPNGAGIPAQVPRLSGQFAEYTAAQLKAFRSGARANDPNRMMRVVAEKLSDREIEALAEYVAGLR
jgi:cytochrome c553